ncbi:MAG: hypothetical protein NTX68_02040 [Rhodococcus sp.]|jgi:hypothetical protein|uniref:hypothetical protein n=1 Tax=Nocardiaceae TaxID=85025 RepID=UPI001D170D29|nr:MULTISPECIES: hypothetical protein [Rhodococcus]MCX6489753.1 hypothetical protein [Rhodococcus sp. (in: high G+C Gram-positive bacteria)]MDJ0002635.1 hypothetical protein [Rhodococcus fascians]MDJ0410085.1 hypothetical protein [Rhodococcus fascians]MDJ0425884.1 hypothetical protein [Rhodococcus fascians]MDJ0470364.1 hypothetical protein [Rhodococcus fascians]
MRASQRPVFHRPERHLGSRLDLLEDLHVPRVFGVVVDDARVVEKVTVEVLDRHQTPLLEVGRVVERIVRHPHQGQRRDLVDDDACAVEHRRTEGPGNRRESARRKPVRRSVEQRFGDVVIVDRLVEAEEADRLPRVLGERQIVDGHDATDGNPVLASQKCFRDAGGGNRGRRCDENSAQVHRLVG